MARLALIIPIMYLAAAVGACRNDSGCSAGEPTSAALLSASLDWFRASRAELPTIPSLVQLPAGCCSVRKIDSSGASRVLGNERTRSSFQTTIRFRSAEGRHVRLETWLTSCGRITESQQFVSTGG